MNVSGHRYQKSNIPALKSDPEEPVCHDSNSISEELAGVKPLSVLPRLSQASPRYIMTTAMIVDAVEIRMHCLARVLHPGGEFR